MATQNPETKSKMSFHVETTKMESIRYRIIVDTEETDDRLRLLHENIKKYGTVFNTIAPGTDLVGEIRRK